MPPRPEFRQVTRLLRPPTSPLAMTVMSQTGIRPAYGEWRNPPLLTLSPSRKEARDQRHTQLRSTLLHWGRKHPGRTGLRGAEQSVPTIPLEPAPARGYRLPAAAAGGARNLAPTSPTREEAYSPPLEADDQWTSAGPVGSQPVVNRVSPLVAQQSSSEPTEVGGGAVGLPPAYVDTYDLTFPGSRMGWRGPQRCHCYPKWVGKLRAWPRCI